MGLLEERERLRTALAESLQAENEEGKEQEESIVEQEEEPAVEEPAKEEAEAPKEEEKPEAPAKEEKPVAEEAPDKAAFQKLRRENAAARKRMAELETQLAQKEQAPAEEVIAAEAAPISPELEEIVQKHRFNRAEEEFKSMERRYAATNPEYEAVSAEYAMALAQSIRLDNPHLSPAEIAERTKEKILKKAANFLKDGFDPIEELYHTAKELGFTGKSFQRAAETEVQAKEEPKPDMKKLAQNRARSTGMGATTGRSEGMLTKEAAANMPIGEWSRLPKETKQRLLYG